VNFFDADGLSGKDLAEIDFFVVEPDAATAGDHDGFVVEGIVDVRQPGIGTQGRLVDLRWAFHIQSYLRYRTPRIPQLPITDSTRNALTSQWVDRSPRETQSGRVPVGLRANRQLGLPTRYFQGWRPLPRFPLIPTDKNNRCRSLAPHRICASRRR